MKGKEFVPPKVPDSSISEGEEVGDKGEAEGDDETSQGVVESCEIPYTAGLSVTQTAFVGCLPCFIFAAHTLYTIVHTCRSQAS